jgi:predicted RNA methylase
LISVRSNAKSFNQRKGADVIISENIYTGMFFEKQIDIVKSLRGNLKKGGTIIPSGMKSYIALCSIKTKNKKDKFLVLNEINEKPLIFTDRGAYDLIDFLKIKRRAVSKKINLPVLKDGVADSVIISSDVLLHSGNIIGSLDTDFMNNDVIIKLGRKLILKAGEVVSIKVTYTYGSSPLRAKFVVKRI